MANAAGEDAELWLAARQAEAEKAGVGLLAKTLPGASGKEEINIVPTIIKRELIRVSGLLPERDGAMAFARVVKADVMDRIDAEHPFRLLVCGPRGAAGILETLPDDVQTFATLPLDLCPELHADYQIRLGSEGKDAAPNSPDETKKIVELLARDISKDCTFWFPWGVDH